MSNYTLTAPMASEQPRTILGGRSEQGVYVITLDGHEEVETSDKAVYAAAAAAKKAGRSVLVDLEVREGQRPRLVEIRPATDAPTAITPAAVAPAVAAPTPLPPSGLIQRPEELTARLQELSRHYNVLSPAIAVSEMAPGFGANLAVVQIDPDVRFDLDHSGRPISGNGPDCYWSRTIHGSDLSKRSLNKTGLQKIAQALGIQWDHRACRRLDDGRERNYWLWRYVGYIRTHDGQLLTVEGSRELDLRDGSVEAQTMTEKQLRQARAMGNQLCETKAMQRAIRTFVRQVYTVDELQKPFLIVRFSFTPDMSDPEIKKLVTERALAGIGQLYMAPPVTALPPVEAVPALPTVEAAAVAADGPTPPVETPPVAAAPDDPPGVTRIAKLETRTGQNQRGTWTQWKVAFTNGQVAATFNAAIGERLARAEAEGLPVRYQTEPTDGPYDDRLIALEIVDTRQAALPMTADAEEVF